MRKVCVTGHRPPRIGGYDPTNPLRQWVKDQLVQAMDEIRPNVAYTGMALGTDQVFAEICIERKIPFIAVLPFKGQDNKWPKESQFIYWRLVHQAREIITVCEPGYAAWKLQRRNERMIEEIETDGTVIAVWDGSIGGTANCLTYAKQLRRTIHRIDPKEYNPVEPDIFL